jgi:hypothetical protein
MGWSGNRITGQYAAAGGETAAEDLLIAAEGGEEPGEPKEAGLMLLATDASGPYARRIHCFHDAGAATRFIKFWYPYRLEGSVRAYWLLRDEPSLYEQKEWGAALVLLVRDAGRRGVVYEFPFEGVSQARQFLRQETEHGLDMRQVLLLWALPARIERDWRGDVILFPPSMPEGLIAGNPSVSAIAEKAMAAAKALRAEPTA